MDGKTLRHECESGELQSFNWLEHHADNALLFCTFCGSREVPHKSYKGEGTLLVCVPERAPRHDGRNYGRQVIEDQKLQAKLQTTFVKESHQKLHARVEAETLSNSNSNSTRPMSLFLYLGVEAGDHHLQVESQDSEWETCGDFSCRSLVLTGTDPSGPFRARLSFTARLSGRRHRLCFVCGFVFCVLCAC